MKLSESLRAIGPSFPYYPKLCPVVGGVKACIFLCCIFWKGFEDTDGWVQISQESLERETGMTPKEQLWARRALLEKGLLDEKEDRLAHKSYYRIKTEALDQQFGNSGCDKTDNPGTTKGSTGERQNGSSLLSSTQITPSTRESERVEEADSELGGGYKNYFHAIENLSVQAGLLYDRTDTSLSPEDQRSALGVVKRKGWIREMEEIQHWRTAMKPEDLRFFPSMSRLLADWPSHLDRARLAAKANAPKPVSKYGVRGVM